MVEGVSGGRRAGFGFLIVFVQRLQRISGNEVERSTTAGVQRRGRAVRWRRCMPASHRRRCRRKIQRAGGYAPQLESKGAQAGANPLVNEDIRLRMGDLLVGYLTEAVTVLRQQAVVGGDSEYLKKQSAADLAVLHREFGDRPFVFSKRSNRTLTKSPEERSG